MITKVKLKSWRSHLETELDFSEGTNALIGIMGSGKTSILDAVCFGLFGTFPNLQSKKIRLEDMIMKKPKEQAAAEVTVNFELGGTDWSVKRTVSKTKPTAAELRKNGEMVEGPQPGRVNEVIEKLLKMNYDLFTRAIYSEQNSIDMFLTIPKGQRMKKIDELLAIDRFEKARATAVSLGNRFEAAVSERQSVLSSLLSDPSINGLQSLKSECETLRKDRANAGSQLSECGIRLKAVERNHAEMKERRERLIAIQQELAAATALLSSLEADIQALKKDLTVEEIAYAEYTDEKIGAELAAIESEERTADENVGTERKRLADLNGMLASKAAKLEGLTKDKIPELRRQKEEAKRIKQSLKAKNPEKISKLIEELKADLRKAEASARAAEVQIPEVEQSIGDLSAVGGACPICDQPLTDKKKEAILAAKKAHIGRLRAQITKSVEAAEALEKELGSAEKDIAHARVLEAKLETLSDIDPKLDFAEDAVAVLEKELSEIGKEARMTEKAVSLLETEMADVRKRAERMRFVVGKRTDLSTKQKKQGGLQQKLGDLTDLKAAMRGFSQPELERLENERTVLASRIGSLETRLSSTEPVLKQKEGQVRDIEDRLRVIDEHRLGLERLKGHHNQMSVLESALLDTQIKLRRNFITAVNMAMHDIWSDLYPYRDFYSCRLDIDSGDYVLQLQDSTGWVPADGMASGGERAMACLALRIAFALVLAPQLRWLVLDEPTHNLDAKAVEDLANVLRERISEFVDQVFLITHDPTMESAVSGYLYKLERDKETDGATKAVLVSGPENQ
jgi:exonuclease SbcC